MLTELNGKGGTLCKQASEGEIRCPLHVRPNSEDVITGEIFGVLDAVNPQWWLVEFINQSVGWRKRRSGVFRNLRIKLWTRQALFPRNLLPWREGQTEVDVEISFDNPPTTIFIEMKYGSPISKSTTHHSKKDEMPNDQIIRNIRVGLWKTGWISEARLFEPDKRDFMFILCTALPPPPEIDTYRSNKAIRELLPGTQGNDLPEGPFVGDLRIQGITEILSRNHCYMSRSERVLSERLGRYLQQKVEYIENITRPAKQQPCMLQTLHPNQSNEPTCPTE